MSCACQSVFNTLSKADRMQLRSVALMTAITGFVRDETLRNPWRYPLYAGYLVVVAAPVPMFGLGIMVMIATVAWAKTSKTLTARRLQSYMREAFDGAALVRRYGDMIEPAYEGGSPAVDGRALARGAAREAAQDSRIAARYAGSALKRLVMG